MSGQGMSGPGGKSPKRPKPAGSPTPTASRVPDQPSPTTGAAPEAALAKKVAPVKKAAPPKKKKAAPAKNPASTSAAAPKAIPAPSEPVEKLTPAILTDTAQPKQAKRVAAKRVVADPVAVEVVVAGSADLEPVDDDVDSDLDLAEPDLVHPDLVDPDLADPDLADPDLADHDLADHDLADPDLADHDRPSEPTPVMAVLGATPAAIPREARWSARDRDRERELVALLAQLPPDDPQRAAVRDELVRMHMPLAAFLARRFRDRGEHLDDLTQVATVGLIKAVDRFEPGRGVEFSTFATPTIVGEIKRHFRDKGWAIRVPRRLQEMRLAITRATAELSQAQGTSPTVAQLAAHLKLSEEEILEGLESAAAYATVSLDSGGSGDAAEEGASIAETVGDLDPNLAEVDNRATLHPLLATLGEREQRIVYMRFFENKTQAQIAEEIGVSQMHISRLLAKSLAQMRTDLTAEA